MDVCIQPDLDKNFTKNRFLDRVFIVTGGTTGIGLATAERLCNDGAAVALFARNEERGKKAVSLLQAEGYTKVKYFSVDVSKPEDCERGVQEVVREFGNIIHGLVNNAGIVNFYSTGEDEPNEGFERILAINLKGPFYLVKSCLPHLKQGTDCAIVNVSGNAGQGAIPGLWGYSASKGGLDALTRCMALDLNAYKIRVNGLGVGPTWTDIHTPNHGERSVGEPKLSQNTMMERCGEASEIAATAAFLLSKDASFITGHILNVEGGSLAMCPRMITTSK